MEFIELKDVYKVYKNGVTGLAGVNLQIKKGDFDGWNKKDNTYRYGCFLCICRAKR